MKKKIVIVVVVLGIILSLFVGCKDDLIETLEKVQAYVEISVKLPKSLTPDNYKFEEYDFILQWYKVNDDSHKDEKEFEYEEIKDKVIVYQFDPGEYIFELSSYDGSEIKAFGKASTSIERGQREQLEIPMTYYVYGEGNGFIVEHSVITLKGELEFKGDMITISVPDGMKLVIEDGSSIKVEAGETLTFNSAVEASSNLVIDGDLNITDEFKVNGNLEVTGDLTVSETGNLNANGNLTFESIDVKGKAKVDSLIPKEGVTDLSITIASNGSIETTNISNTYEKVSIDGGGTLKVNSDTALKEIELDDSKLEVTGTLSNKNETGIKLSGGGGLEASSIETSKLTSNDNNKITSDDIQIGELELENNKTLNLIGNTTVEKVTGTGSAIVDGTVIVDGADLSINNGATLEAKKLVTEDDSIKIINGGTLKIKGDTALKKIDLGNSSKLEVTGTLSNKDESGIIVSGDSGLEAGSIETSKLTNINENTIKAGTFKIGELALEDSKTLTLDGKIKVEEISGSGKAKVEGEIEADNLLIENGVTLDLTDGTSSMEVAGEVTLEGILEIADWDTVTFGTQGNIILAENNANLKINGTTIKWYTLNGAKAKYYKADDEIQLEFIVGSEDNEVTPKEPGIPTTESITRVGAGVTFDADYKKGLKLGSGEFILESGSITITSKNWWTEDNTFDVENGAIVVNVGAEVFDKDDKLWLGGTDSVEWKLSGSAQMRFKRIDGIGTTTVKNTGTSTGAQLDIVAWDNHKLGHNLVIENNAKVLVSMDHFMAAEGDGGEIKIEEEGVFEIGSGTTLKTAYQNQLTIGGQVIINNGSTLDLFDGWFTWEDDESGSVLLKSGGTLKEKEKIYFGPDPVNTDVALNIYYETDKADIEFVAAGSTGENNNTPIKKYTISTDNLGTFSPKSNSGGIVMYSHIISLSDGVTLLPTGNLTLANGEKGNISKITVGNGAILDLNGKTLNIKDTREVEVKSGGTLLTNDGAVAFEDGGKLVMGVGSILNNDNPLIDETVYDLNNQLN